MLDEEAAIDYVKNQQNSVEIFTSFDMPSRLHIHPAFVAEKILAINI